MLRIPINHFEGNYTVDAETLARLRDEDRVVLRYVDNPNGSVDDIAGVCNEGRNVVGLMPHPERAAHELLGSTDGVPCCAACSPPPNGPRSAASRPRQLLSLGLAAGAGTVLVGLAGRGVGLGQVDEQEIGPVAATLLADPDLRARCSRCVRG